MAERALPVALYDFLYKDTDRLTSYYAQMFQGKLLGVERTTATKDNKEASGKLSVGLAGGDVRATEETLESLKETIDPHDRAINDVLAYLVENNHVSQDLDEAKHGEIVLVEGTLFLVDRTMLELAATGLEVAAPGQKKPGQQTSLDNNTKQILRRVIQKLSLPSACLLHVSDDLQVVGTLKEAGLQEPISSFYFKHGSGGLADIVLMGIKEQASSSIPIKQTAFIGLAQGGANALSIMLFPEEAIRVTPLALFRKIF